MKLTVSGDVSLTYVETLFLIFFPGIKFSENSVDNDGIVSNVISRHEGDVETASAEVTAFGKTVTGYGRVTSQLEPNDMRRVKAAVGEAVFKACTELLGTTPPWGMISGVRPSKFAVQYLASGMSDEDVIKRLTDEYYVYRNKAELVTRVARTESALIASLPENSCSLYVSIPFCPTRCSYCSFVSYSTPRLLSLIPEYLDALCSEVERVCCRIRSDDKIPHTVYIGGGTPTTLSAEQLERLLATIEKHIDVSSLREFTLEAGRPDTITKEKLECAARHGVTRISINPQTLCDDVLREIGRAHTADDFRRAYAIARESGIPIINTDLIVGLPGDTLDSFKRTAEEIVALDPENITVHAFTVKRAATITERGEAVYSYTGGDAGACIDYISSLMADKGYCPYYLYRQKNSVGNLENTGFSLPGKEGLYNILIMEEVHNIYGVGAGAVTKFVGAPGEKIKREFELKYPYEWLERLKNDQFMK